MASNETATISVWLPVKHSQTPPVPSRFSPASRGAGSGGSGSGSGGSGGGSGGSGGGGSGSQPPDPPYLGVTGNVVSARTVRPASPCRSLFPSEITATRSPRPCGRLFHHRRIVRERDDSHRRDAVGSYFIGVPVTVPGPITSEMAIPSRSAPPIQCTTMMETPRICTSSLSATDPSTGGGTEVGAVGAPATTPTIPSPL